MRLPGPGALGRLSHSNLATNAEVCARSVLRVNPGDASVFLGVPTSEIGEIAIQGPNVMKGYWRQPEATRAVIPDGWFRTGDMAKEDEEGYLYIVGRTKELIIRGGLNVYPRDVEEVLHQHPAIATAVVLGIPHPTLGEEVAAVVVLKHGATANPIEIRSWVRERVADYKYPRQVRIVESLPLSPTGKILRRAIVFPA